MSPQLSLQEMAVLASLPSPSEAPLDLDEIVRQVETHGLEGTTPLTVRANLERLQFLRCVERCDGVRFRSTTHGIATAIDCAELMERVTRKFRGLSKYY